MLPNTACDFGRRGYMLPILPVILGDVATCYQTLPLILGDVATCYQTLPVILGDVAICYETLPAFWETWLYATKHCLRYLRRGNGFLTLAAFFELTILR